MDKPDGANFFHNVYDMLDEMTPRKTKVRFHDNSSHSEIIRIVILALSLKTNVLQFQNSKQNQDSMSEQLNISLRDQLIDLGINEILIDELVSVASRVNYGQVISLLYLISVVVYKFFPAETIYVHLVVTF